MLPRELLFRITRFSPPIPTKSHSLRFASTSPSRRSNVIDHLEQRGLLADLTSRAVRKHVETPQTVYLGVDPSAPSLHVGNLLALIGLLHFRLHGHSAIALVCSSLSSSSRPISEVLTASISRCNKVGGATGSVGDPSGRSTERNALPPEVLSTNIKSITKQIKRILQRGLTFAQSRNRERYPPPTTRENNEGHEGNLRVENNLEWLGDIGLLEFLSTVGKYARMSTMLSRESVRSRLESSSGLSFTEFSYQLLQAYDFLLLHQRHNCSIQLGGSDQLGNIQSGIEMIRKNHFVSNAVHVDQDVDLGVGEREGEEKAYGVVMPLLTTSSGEKFGKSAGNAVWLDASLTSPFDFYQFFIRTTDEDAFRYLKIFTFVRIIELEDIMADHKAHPNARLAQRVLAAEATELVHGSASLLSLILCLHLLTQFTNFPAHGLQQALAATSVFFGTDLSKSNLNIRDTTESLDARPTLSVATSSEVPSMLVRLKREDHVGKSLEGLLVASGLMPSKTQARKAIDVGTIHLNGVKIPPRSHQRMIEETDLLEGGLVVLRSGRTVHKAVLLE